MLRAAAVLMVLAVLSACSSAPEQTVAFDEPDRRCHVGRSTDHGADNHVDDRATVDHGASYRATDNPGASNNDHAAPAPSIDRSTARRHHRTTARTADVATVRAAAGCRRCRRVDERLSIRSSRTSQPSQ